MHGRLALAALCASLLLLIPAASAGAANDSFDAPRPLFLGTVDVTVDNAAATVQPGETLTAEGGAGLTHCIDGATTSQAARTVWWWVLGTGRPVTVSTAGSSFDTHLGIFAGPIGGGALCQDASMAGESITFDSVAGHAYRIQVGGCASSLPYGCGAATSGRVQLLATSPAPANDLRAAAAALPTGQVVTGDNFASEEEAGEAATCGALPYGRTVWYRWSAPSIGSVRFVVAGANPAVAVYSQSGARLGCDATPGADARVTLAKVPRGDLLVQVGGVGAHAGLAGDSAQSAFTLQAAFAESSDRDGDGVGNTRDCRPDDPRVHKRAKDRSRNGVDEDCDGRDGLALVASRARLAVALFSRYAKVTAISARNVPAGARVQLRCSGRSCPYRHTRVRKIRRARSSVSLMTTKLGGTRIVPRTTLEVRVTRAGRIGRVMRFRFTRRGRGPVQQVRCLVPGERSPTRC